MIEKGRGFDPRFAVGYAGQAKGRAIDYPRR